jgi:hypothetical protein
VRALHIAIGRELGEDLMIVASRAVCLAWAGMVLSGCGSTVLQSEASPSPHPPPSAHPVNRIAAYVAGPDRLVASFQADIAVEAGRRGLATENASVLFPPTHAYADAEIRQGLAARSIDSVMIVKIGDAGAPRQYAGTILQERGGSSGPAAAAVASVNGDPHPTTYSYRLVDAATGRKLWAGDGQIASGAISFMANGNTVEDAVSALFDELQEKGVIGPAGQPSLLPVPGADRGR